MCEVADPPSSNAVKEAPGAASDAAASDAAASDAAASDAAHARELADQFLERNNYLLAYARELSRTSTFRHERVRRLLDTIDSALEHLENLTGYYAPASFSSELAFQLWDANSPCKFWQYSDLAMFIAERIPEHFYLPLGAIDTNDLAAEISAMITTGILLVLCGNEKMRNDVIRAARMYYRHAKFGGYPRDGIHFVSAMCNPEGKSMVEICLHLFPDFIPKQGSVIEEIGLLRRKGAIETAILMQDINGGDCYSKNYYTIAWGLLDQDGEPWEPVRIPQSMRR